MTVVCKLGGSVITDKDTRDAVDDVAIEQVVSALEAASGPLVLVHGGGSVGHPRAASHGVDTQQGLTDPDGLLEIHTAMVDLCERFTAACQASVPAVPVHPLSMAWRDGSTVECAVQPVETLLEAGFVPVLHGDLVATPGRGVTVASGDELVVALARGLEADRVGLCSDVPGVLDADGAVVDRIADRETARSLGAASEATDVTGGMLAKVETLLSLESQASIFGLGDLETFLEGGQPGTTVDGSP